jgi:hypothetical protein
MFTVKFKVNRIWKGQESEEIKMLTGTKDNGDGTFTSSSCDYSFSKGQKNLVYAYGPPEELKTHACCRTVLLKYAEEEMRGLDEITPQRAVGEVPKPDGQAHLPRGRNLTMACTRPRIARLSSARRKVLVGCVRGG